MHNDFSTRLKYAGARITTPEAPLTSIIARSHEARKRGKVRAFITGAVITIATIGTATAYGTGLLEGARIWLTGDKAAAQVSSFELVDSPNMTDLTNVVRDATFPVVLPMGMPSDAHIIRMMRAPAAHPNAITIMYRSKSAQIDAGFTLVERSAVNYGNANVPGAGRLNFSQAYVWDVGRETVVVPKRTLSQLQADTIKVAMLAAAPAASLAATRRLVPAALILGHDPTLTALAQRLSPSSQRAVALDSKTLQSVPRLLAHGRPLLDTHIVLLTNIPTRNGGPDYAKATLTWPPSVAVTAGGLRAIDAAFKASAARPNCSVIISEPRGKPYEVQLITAPGSIKKYAVDRRTFVVSPLRDGP